MGDYGHPLLFGSFVTPRNDRPAEVVQLAVLSEAVGLDLVTVQDHPYQASYLDTWTLLSFLAARTSTVHLAANVKNLPLRPPAVLACSLASLDLLSGGRIELGLGAGAFWDAIVAMGGRRLTPGEGVQAVEEAVTIIRQLWDTDTRGGVRADAALRPRRPGRRGVGERRGRALRHQRDGHAAEQVDRGHVLRVLLPDRDDPSQPGGRSHVPALKRADRGSARSSSASSRSTGSSTTSWMESTGPWSPSSLFPAASTSSAPPSTSSATRCSRTSPTRSASSSSPCPGSPCTDWAVELAAVGHRRSGHTSRYGAGRWPDQSADAPFDPVVIT